MKLRIIIASLAIGLCTASMLIYAQSASYTYQQDILPILSGNNCTSCHSWAGNYENLMDQTSSNAPVGVAIVLATEPDASMLVWRLEGQTAEGDPIGQMPQGGSPLDADTIQMVRDWISQGARYDDAVGVREATWGEIKHDFK